MNEFSKTGTKKIKTFSFDIGTASIGWAVVNNPDDNKQYDEDTGEVFENIEIVASGVRMFNEPVVAKTGELLNITRRASRLLRRRTRRVVLRKERIKKLLLSLGFYKKEDFDHFLDNGEINNNSVFQRVIFDNKKDPNKFNIFYLRVKGLDHQLTKDELAVVLFNLAKTRGFKSSKKIRKNEDELQQLEETNNNEADKESGAVLKAIKELKSIQNKVKQEYGKETRTLAELIYFLNSIKEKISYRNKGSDYSNSILRKDIELETKLIFAKQREFYSELTQEFEASFIDAMMYQRDIKFDTNTIGKCTYIKEEFRASKSCFSSEYYTSLTRLLNVRIILDDKNQPNEFLDNTKDGFALNKKAIDNILTKTAKKYGDLKYKQLRKELNLNDKDYFKGLSYSTESNNSHIYAKDAIEDDAKKLIISFKESKKVNKYLEDLKKSNKLSSENYDFITDINNYKLLDQLVQLNCLYNEKDIIKKIENSDNLKNLPQEIKDAIIYCNLSFTQYIQLSLKAVYAITEIIKEVYPKAITNGLKTDIDDIANRWESKRAIKNLLEDGIFKEVKFEKLPKLPNLKEIEKQGDFYIPNHSVIKRALSQVIKTFNAMVQTYDKPDLVNIELLRELKSPSGKNKYTQKREDNTIAKIQATNECKEYGITKPNEEPSESDILKIRLWKDQAHSCPYCQQNISITDLSDEGSLQVDHIIPESISFDNSYNNKVLVHDFCNQEKGKRTPCQWLINDNAKWSNFKNWVYNSNLPKPKIARLLNEQTVEQIKQGFVERQKNDSAYITVLIKDFIENYFDFGDDKKHVYATKGALTSLLRYSFGFKKYRKYEDLKLDKGYFLYKEIIWNKEKNPNVIAKLKAIKEDIKLAKKTIYDAKKNGEKEPVESKKSIDDLEKKFKSIREGFVEYLVDYFSDVKNLKTPKAIQEYLDDSMLSSYLAELKIENNFAEDFKKLEKNFIGDKHHAMDAILIALLNGSMIQGIGTLSSQADEIIRNKANSIVDTKEKNKLLRFLYNSSVKEKIKFLLENEESIKDMQKQGTFKISKIVERLSVLNLLKDDIWKSLDKIFISRQPNRKVSGRIHEDTIYSAKETKKYCDEKGNLKLTKRINVTRDIDTSKIVGDGCEVIKQAIEDWKKTTETYPTMPTKNGSQGPAIKKVTIATGESGESYYNVRGGVVDSDKKIRVDVFKIKQTNKKGEIIYKYALRPITLADIILKKEAPLKLTGSFGYLDSEQGGENQEFMFSLYPNDLFLFQKDEKSNPEYAYYLSYHTGANKIEYTDHNKLEKYKNPFERLFLSIGSIYNIQKAQVDLLGNISIVKNNEYEDFSNLLNKINNKKK